MIVVMVVALNEMICEYERTIYFHNPSLKNLQNQGLKLPCKVFMVDVKAREVIKTFLTTPTGRGYIPIIDLSFFCKKVINI